MEADAEEELAALAAQQLGLSDSDWLDITALVRAGARTLGSGELIKQPSLTLFDAMTSVEVMDARLDMGMLSAEDAAEIAQWDIARPLSLADALWIVERLFCCEMTWHHSASLLQTIYTCNYFTADPLPATIGSSDGGPPLAARDLVVYPLLIATAACCRLVWAEYARENVYAEEDVHLAGPRIFFDAYALPDVARLLDAAQAFLAANDGTPAAGALLAHVTMRRRWLAALAALAAERLADDPGALALGVRELEAVAQHVAAISGQQPMAAAAVVAGVFDAKCMRRFPSLAPVKPRPLLALDAALATLRQLAEDLMLVAQLVRAESVESLVHFFLALSRRCCSSAAAAAVLPYVRSLLVSVFASDGRVQLAQPLPAFVRRAISEVSNIEGVVEDGERVDLFCGEAARMLVDWFRTLCQNPPRQRRIALKYLAAWDALQGDAEQLDIWLYTQSHHHQKKKQHCGALCAKRDEEEEDRASDPAYNAFALSSWAYHMKLLLMSGALTAGIRLSVYQAYEFPLIFCYAAQIFEAHALHLQRMLHMSKRKEEEEEEGDGGHDPKSDLRAMAVQWTVRRVSGAERVAQLERWEALAVAQKELATALWLVSHACERLGSGEFRAPWARRNTQLALKVCVAQETEEAQRARFALRFRAFSRLNSPTPLTFDAWDDTRRQLDVYSIADLFTHAARILTDAKHAMDRSKPCFLQGNSNDEEAMLFRGALYYVVLANSVALAKLLKNGDIVNSPCFAVTGAEAVAFRSALVNDALGIKVRAKKGKKSKPKCDLVSRAREWQNEVSRLVSSGTLNIAWTTAADRHPDWPVFTFQ
ncbi:N-alpha-acetyltransferase, non-catalitic subunit [Coemansia sp. RSA 2681]|nr:N-alpha-acetyltransferase, non-catalitic subunit [Coemansia sp. RSA 2681]